MRKGFSVTLAMVAFAMLVIKASALAPTIDDLPDVIIGDAENTSGANVFVYPDAINLTAIGHDDMTSSSALIWSFAEDGASQPYVINKALPSSGSDSLVNPSAAKRIDNQWDPMDPTTGTLGARTITFRDILRSPLTGPGSPAGPYADNLNGTGATSSTTRQWLDSAVVTLFASDGSTVSLDNAKSFIVYTRDNEYDSLSGILDNVVYRKAFGTDHTGWTFTGTGGTQSVDTVKGLCINVGLTGDNDAQWSGAYPIVTLAANSVWEARLNVTTTQTNAFATPMWMLVYDNFDGVSTGQNEYGGEFFFLDNEGGANSPISGIGRSSFKVYMMPSAMQTTQFSSSTNGFFSTALDPSNDFRVILRVFDIGSGGYGAQLDSGTVCWSDITIVQHDLADMVVDSTVMNVSAFTNAMTDTTKTMASWGKDPDVGQTSNLTGWGGAVTIAPTTDWNTGTIQMFRPGDQSALSTSDPTVNADNYPIQWVDDTLYYVEFRLSAISATTESNPPDVIRVGADTETAELTFDNFITPNTPDFSTGTMNTRGLSMPRTGTAQKYACFFYTHSKSKTGIPDGARWRPRFEILTNNTMKPLGLAGSPYGLIVNGCTIQKVHFSK